MVSFPLLRRCALAAFLATGVFFIIVARAAEVGTELITAADLAKIAQLDGAVISPDGKNVVYTVKTMEEKSEPAPGEKKPETKGEYVYRTHLWIAPIDGHATARQLTRGETNDVAPTWSPVGDRIAFVRSVEKEKPQVWILPIAGGESYTVTKLERGASRPRWSPEGHRLLITSRLNASDVRKALDTAGKSVAWPAERPRRTSNDVGNWPDKEAKKPTANLDGSLAEMREYLAKNEADGNPRVTTRLNFIGESDVEPIPDFPQLYVLDADEGKDPKPLALGYITYDEAEWTTNGKEIICRGPASVTLNADREQDSKLYAINVAEGSVREFLTLAGYSLASPKPSPDGVQITFTARQDDDRGYRQTIIGVAPLSGKSKPKLLTESLDRSTANVKWSTDSKSLYFTAASGGDFPLYRVSATGGPIERLTPVEEGMDDYDVSASSLVAVVTEVNNPYELYAATLDAKNPHALSTHNSGWLSSKKLSHPEHHTIKRPDGLVVEAWIMRPTTYVSGKTYPLLLEIHGGPQAMWGPGEASMWHELQYFAARGYGIVYSNPRGSGGYGYAFQRGNFQNWGEGPSNDILAAADLAAKEPWVDVNRQIVTGGSYGGYMTAWIVSHDHRFKAAVAVRGVYDLVTFFGEGNAWRLVPWQFGGYPWDKKIRDVMEKNSPFTYVEQITTPLLIKHGDTDFRTGYTQSEMLYKALKVMGRDVEYARYPHATH
ncbi:MAG TPA: S9 family peptidase, partial [Opitutaceae bacterium]|nr:S9 family peptidase [Opitutaceae bacterium]